MATRLTRGLLGALVLLMVLASTVEAARRRRPPVKRKPSPVAEQPGPAPSVEKRAPESAVADVSGPAAETRDTVEDSSTATEASTAAAAASARPDVFAPKRQMPPSRPLGWAGGSKVQPSRIPATEDFVPIPDRWRLGFPDYAVWQRGEPIDPYGQNLLKGDYPIAGQHTFLNLTAITDNVFEVRKVPTATGVSTFQPGVKQFFGNGYQDFFKSNAIMRLTLFSGNAGFKPFDWQLRLTPIINLRNKTVLNEVGQLLPDQRRGVERTRNDISIEEYFFEVRLADVSPNFDFLSARAGSQPFISDFRGFVFNDINRGARVFGSAESNRLNYNLVYFDMLEKEINSELNTGRDRDQKVAVANVYRQDSFWPGYTTQLSLHYNRDEGTLKYDENGILRRPALIGTVDPTGASPLEVWYAGFAGEGHIGRLNISHTFYQAWGEHSFNALANRKVDVDARMFALELSEDRDWLRWKLSWFWSSGDSDPTDGEATGFDSILDNPNFAGGGFSFISRQGLGLLGVSLFSPNSLLPSMRSNKLQGQANFVNPGVNIVGIGGEFELTPKLKALLDVNHIQFNSTEPIELFVNQTGIHKTLGIDVGLGFRYRPMLNENIVLVTGANILNPRAGFRDIFEKGSNQFSAFTALTLTY